MIDKLHVPKGFQVTGHDGAAFSGKSTYYREDTYQINHIKSLRCR